MAQSQTLPVATMKKSVLIVDDEIESLRGIVDFFKENDWKVTTAFDEQEAVLEFERVNPSLVLLDLVLETECGFEVLTQFRRLNPKTKIVIISKYFDNELIKQAMKAGAMGFLQKADGNDLPAGLSSLLRGSITLKS